MTSPDTKCRPRRPYSVPLADLPDDALVPKEIRRAMTGLGDTTAYKLIKENRYPAPVRLTATCVRWRMGDLRRYVADPVNYRIREAQ